MILLSAMGLTPLWLDEVLQLANTRGTSLHELIRWIELNAGAVPLPYLFQNAVVNALGTSAFAARIPAALCSALSGIVFAMLCPQFLKRGRAIAIAAFLVLPLQFRYGLEARGYSQGLLFCLISLWLFLRLSERPSTRLAVLYGISVALGLYSQPLTLFPALAQVLAANRRARWPACLALGAAGVSFLPWYFAQRTAQVQYAAAVSKPTAFFSIHQIAPGVLLHDLSGGGYICTIAILLLALWGAFQKNRLLLVTVGVSILGPILMDAAFHYFFAERQLLFAMPALVLLAWQGEAGKPASYVWFLLAALFFGSALVKDFRLATVPKDGLAATADAIAARIHGDSCLITAPREQASLYVFFRPELQEKICGVNPAAPAILAVASSYSTPAEKRALLDSLASGYEQKTAVAIGQSEIWTYRHR
ncbi:MAG TPA: glycosyltransferase family 39 protein [Bryobacteraceae bacterium]|nr:glycosyltransferase family 39 protein [Bryobacteraceae bacterium]